MYEALSNTNLIPKSEIIKTEKTDFYKFQSTIDFPYWIREISEGSTSGLGSMLVKDTSHLIAWSLMNSKTKEAMISEYLPGKNIAIHYYSVREI